MKLSLFSYDKIYIDNPKESIKEILEVIREFSKVLRYKFNIIIKFLSWIYLRNTKFIEIK